MTKEQTQESIQNNEVPKQRNAYIDIFRIVCAIMVIVIHTFPFKDINPVVESILVDYFPRIAVPFFLCVISYFYIKKLNEGQEVKSTWIRLLRTYLIWTVVYFVYKITYLLTTGKFELSQFLLNTLSEVLLTGTGYQLWFFPAVFIGLGVITLCHKFKILKPVSIISFVFFVIGLLGSIYYKLGNAIPVVSDIVNWVYFYDGIQRPFSFGLIFIFMGYFLYEFLKTHKKNNKLYISLLCVTFVFYVAEIFLAIHFNLQSNVKLSIFLWPLVFFIMVLLFTNGTNNPKTIKVSKATRDMSNFMYYSHVLILNLFGVINEYIITIPYFYTVSFFVTLIISALLGFIVHKCKNEKIKKYLL